MAGLKGLWSTVAAEPEPGRPAAGSAGAARELGEGCSTPSLCLNNPHTNPQMSAVPLVLSLKKRLQAAVTANKTEVGQTLLIQRWDDPAHSHHFLAQSQEIISILGELKKSVVATEDLIRVSSLFCTLTRRTTFPQPITLLITTTARRKPRLGLLSTNCEPTLTSRCLTL